MCQIHFPTLLLKFTVNSRGTHVKKIKKKNTKGSDWEGERARVDWERERKRNRPKKERGTRFWSRPPPFMDSIFSFFCTKTALCEFVIPLCRSYLFFFFFFFWCSHQSSFIFSTMNMVELLKKIKERDVCVGVIGVGGGHQGFGWWVWWYLDSCGGVKFWVND